ncbi:AfsR/SARP family transcriptional regulator [Phytohabitans rumicis]|uniref:OmpR/PhoB-type domain-containing protein n=1 Tax=Phytohabitans rumicis TaxID=1076125 RepID=A0A6V8LK81_9ACTN|nr:AfsR/SARP family transcriptional regulator [Phytohabitans rumicis]GFJ95960.1 hypothetical protein Prum_096020 [Phytohabitans rumicis]
MRFRVLGPVQVRGTAGWSTIRTTKQRQVLAILLARAGYAVSADRIATEIWGEHPPPTVIPAIRVYVMHLRRTIGAGAARTLVTRNRGYEMAIDESDLDAWVFDRLLRSARHRMAQGDRPAAAATLSEALALWQGPAMADVPSGGTPAVAAEVTRLEHRRLSAADLYFAAQLDLGRHAEVVDDLAEAVARHPLREPLREQLMLALYRCGRRVEALHSYRRGRELLVAELGLEPGRRLHDLHQAILADRAPSARDLAARP